MNDIGNCTDEHLLSFADDTTLIVSSNDEKTLFHKANTEMDKLYDWFCANLLSLNPQKTKYIVIKAPRVKCDLTGLNISINGTPLSRVGTGCAEQSTKFLGVHIDDTLSWKSHMDYINKKISKSLYIIRQASRLLSTECLRTLYFALIHPYLNYGLLAWGNANVGVLHDTIILQKRAIRTISRAALQQTH